jgi:hypothetical protein
LAILVKDLESKKFWIVVKDHYFSDILRVYFVIKMIILIEWKACRVTLRSNQVIVMPSIIDNLHYWVIEWWFLRPGNVLNIWILAV